MGPTGDAVRTIQLHPSLRCNLRCAHCYSTSSPEASGSLEIGAIERFLAEAAEEEYNAIAVSGGEPLLYRDLARLLRHAQALGYHTAVTTNGLPLSERLVAELAPLVRVFALSVDGAPASHDRIRGQAGAFARMRRKLPLLRDAGLPFGFIFTLTMHNLPELDEVARFAHEEGAGLLQVHPLEATGRAEESGLLPPDDLELSYAFLAVARLQRQYPDLVLQYDVADRPLVRRDPARAYLVCEETAAALAELPLGHVLSSLVLQSDGVIVPVQYGFAPHFAIGSLADAAGLRRQAARWKRERLAEFLTLARTTWQAIDDAPAHLPFTNWYAAITTRSRAGDGCMQSQPGAAAVRQALAAGAA